MTAPATSHRARHAGDGSASRKDPSVDGLAHALRRTRPGAASHALLLGICCAFVALAAWASSARVDEVTRAEGRVIPAGRIQVVQHLEGGVVRAIHVRQGDTVEAGDSLLSLSPVQFGGERDSRQQQTLALRAREIRLAAEVRGIEPRFGSLAADTAAAPFIAAERVEYEGRRARLAADLSTVDRQLEQRRKEAQEAEAALTTSERNLTIAREERVIVAALVERGLEPRLELVRLDGRASELQGRVESARIAVPRLAAAVAETHARRDALVKQFRSEAASELSRTHADLRAQSELMPALVDRVARTDIRSPTRGIVNRVAPSTIGATVRPGEPLVEIVPIEDQLVVEARIRPQDIAFVKIGLPARIRLSAYDYSIFGVVDGTVTHVSADVIPGTDREPPAYVARVETAGPLANRDGTALRILPGMQATVDVLTGNKSVLDYLSKPIVAVRENAFRER